MMRNYPCVKDKTVGCIGCAECTWQGEKQDNTPQSLQNAQETASTAKVECRDAGADKDELIRKLRAALRDRVFCGECGNFFADECEDKSERHLICKDFKNDRIAALLGEE